MRANDRYEGLLQPRYRSILKNIFIVTVYLLSMQCIRQLGRSYVVSCRGATSPWGLRWLPCSGPGATDERCAPTQGAVVHGRRGSGYNCQCLPFATIHSGLRHHSVLPFHRRRPCG